jgi:hypothetical protein
MPSLAWDGRKVELLVHDFPDDEWVIEAIWKTFAPSFLKGRSLIVINQYGHKRAEKLRSFLLRKRGELLAVHKPHGSAKGFLYEGTTA